MKTLKEEVKTKYWHHNHCVSKCIYHIVWCTKFRRKVLDNEIQDLIKSLIKEKQEEWKYKVHSIEVCEDHVHLLLQIDPELGVNKVVAKIKGYTSGIIRKTYPKVRSRIPTLWTRGRFIASVGSVSLDIVKKYIEKQPRS